MRIAVANSASELVAAVGAVAGGLLTLAVSLPTLFWLAIGFQFAALAIVLIAVDEPRKRSA
jgi:predicted MFS family arabinose efflux permease